MRNIRKLRLIADSILIGEANFNISTGEAELAQTSRDCMHTISFLTEEDAKARTRVLGIENSEIQTLVLSADNDGLVQSAPIPPVTVRTADGVPSDVHRWYVETQGTIAVIDQSAWSSESVNEVIVRLPYPTTGRRRHDWEVIRDISLPQGIHVRRPRYIESRVRDPAYEVFRNDARGVSYPLYSASSQTEALDLLLYLRRIDADIDAFVTVPEAVGNWIVISELSKTGRVSGRFPSRAAAESLACDMSKRLPAATDLWVVSESGDVRIRIAGGRVASH